MSVFHKVIAIPLLLSLSACGLTPKQWAYVGAGVIVTGYVASHQDGNHRSAAQQVTIQPVNCQATSCQ